MIRILKPRQRIPDRKKLAGPVLDELYEQEKEKVKKNLGNCKATLALEGWSTFTNDPVIGISITREAGVFLTNIIDTIGESHTSEYLINVLKTEANKCEEEWGVRLTSIVRQCQQHESHASASIQSLALRLWLPSACNEIGG